MIMCATCHYEVCDTCSQEEGSLQLLPFIQPLCIVDVTRLNTKIKNCHNDPKKVI